MTTSRAASLVRPGGLLIYKDIDGRPLWRGMANRVHDLMLARQWVHYVNTAQIDAWRVECGLELVSWTSHPQLWYQHLLGIFRQPGRSA